MRINGEIKLKEGIEPFPMHNTLPNSHAQLGQRLYSPHVGTNKDPRLVTKSEHLTASSHMRHAAGRPLMPTGAKTLFTDIFPSRTTEKGTPSNISQIWTVPFVSRNGTMISKEHARSCVFGEAAVVQG